MDFSIILQFGNNILILMSLSVIYALFKNEKRFPPIFRKIIMGIAVAIVMFFVMTNGVVVDDGIIVDARAVVVMVSGMFFGFIPTLFGMVTAIIMRINYGGVGMYTGIGWIIVSGTLGLIWRILRLKKESEINNKINWIEIYVVGLANQIIMILLLFTLPSDLAYKTVNAVAFPLLVIFPLGQALIGQFLILLRRQFFYDISIQESEKQYKQLFSDNTSILMLIDVETGKIVDVNKTAVSVYGYTIEEFKNLTIGHLNTLPTSQVKENMELAHAEGKQFFEFQHIKKNGEIINVEVRTTVITMNSKDYIYSSIVDVSDKVQSEKMFKDADDRLRTTLLSVGEGIIVTDEFDRITVVNNKALKLLRKKGSLERKKIFDELRVYSNQSDVTFEEIYRNCILKNEMFRSDNTYSLLTNDDDKLVFVDFTISPITNHVGINHGAIIVIRDVTIEKERQEEIRFMSRHDYLTGLFNRYNFESEMKRLNTSRQLPISIIIGDLNGLKLVNDAFGHLEGDKLIKEVAAIFKKATRSEDIVARWGGDEFAILLPQTSENGAESVKRRINDLCQKSMYNLMVPSIAIGSATKTSEDEDINNVLNIAEERMYSEKLTDGPKMRDELMHRLFEILNERAIGNLEHIDNLIALVNKYCDHHKLSDEKRGELILLAKYHDIGKITIDPEILNSRRVFTEQERQKVQTHSETGSRILATIQELQFLTKPVLHHHEWWDGNGYPLGLKGTNIPKDARLLAVLDSYESMVNVRHYKETLSHDDAINEILKCTGTQFDPKYTKRFIEIFEKDN